jgi:hypothetical protein
MSKADFETAMKSGKIIKGGKCPYAGGDDEKAESSSAAPPITSGEVDVFEGAAKRRSRGSRGKHGSRKSRSRKSKSKSKSKSRSHSRKSRSHGKKK